FGDNGIASVKIDGNDSYGHAIAIQSDAKIVLVGTTLNQVSSVIDIVLARFNIDGSLDNSFGTNGIVIGLDDHSAGSLAIQTDGKIIVAGWVKDDTYDSDFALSRYLSGLNVGIVNFASSQSAPLIYPNPIQQNEVLEYALTKDETLSLTLIDVNGKLVKQ